MTAAVGRRLLAEFTGTGLLVAVVVGSGIAIAGAALADAMSAVPVLAPVRPIRDDIGRRIHHLLADILAHTA